MYVTTSCNLLYVLKKVNERRRGGVGKMLVVGGGGRGGGGSWWGKVSGPIRSILIHYKKII